MDPSPGGRLARLSRIAVDRAAALTGRVDPNVVDGRALAAVLYRAGGSLPDRRLDTRWPRHLARRAERSVASALADHRCDRGESWDSWTATGVEVTELVHKVYVSPAVSCLGESLAVVFACAADRGVPAWKVGADLAGVHRPDKVVLYLPTTHEADATAEALDLALRGQAAQGVPFSGQVGESGIVSRGRDLAETSWRAVVCRLVAEALWAARSQLAGAGDPSQQDEGVSCVALSLVAAQGFDVVSWHPGRLAVGARR